MGIKSFHDLDVYNNSYADCIKVIKEVLPKLPPEEKYDLKDQLRRSTKAVPRLIAEGYAKRHQKFGFHKYLDDAMAESNETVVGLEMCRDLYGDRMKDLNLKSLIDSYDKTGRMIYNLAKSWTTFSDGRRNLAS
ncbi:MAG: four helix bundle protein [Candidatus Marinimicrobia bacterium]|nr:four helix bundle protein [Candidatus Neomarinimicrobiota bacterium]